MSIFYQLHIDTVHISDQFPIYKSARVFGFFEQIVT